MLSSPVSLWRLLEAFLFALEVLALVKLPCGELGSCCRSVCKIKNNCEIERCYRLHKYGKPCNLCKPGENRNVR